LLLSRREGVSSNWRQARIILRTIATQMADEESTLPPAVIAQAEAAIVGNAGEDLLSSKRRPSRNEVSQVPEEGKPSLK
jgi:hypothetical protein